MGQAASRFSGNKGGRTLRYAQGRTDQLKSSGEYRIPHVADSPSPRRVQEIELAEQTGKLSEVSPDEMQQDPVMRSFLDQLSGRVTKRPIAEYEGKMQQDPITRRQRGQDEALLKGRLSLNLLKDLLEDSQHSKFRRDGQLDVKSLAESYEIDPEVLATVLKYNAMPILKEEPDGKITGSWPER